MTQAPTRTPTPFTLRGTPLLSEGQSMALLARTPRLWLHAKVYAEGGENGLHAHATEDHAFLVLQGRAMFLRPDGSEVEVGALDGLLLPRGTAYSFRSSGDENLVMVRIGCDATDGVVAAAVDQDADVEQLSNPWPRAQTTRVDPDGVAPADVAGQPQWGRRRPADPGRLLRGVSALTHVVRVALDPRAADQVADVLSAVPGVEVVSPGSPVGTAQALAAGAEVLVSFDWHEAYRAPTLRWIQTQGIGFDRFPIAQLHEDGVVLTTAAGVHHTVVAEHAFALLLSLLRNVPAAVRNTDRQVWRPHVGRELAGSTVAVLGLGDIGAAVVRRCTGWDVRVIGITRRPDTHWPSTCTRRSTSAVTSGCRSSGSCPRWDDRTTCCAGWPA